MPVIPIEFAIDGNTVFWTYEATADIWMQTSGSPAVRFLAQTAPIVSRLLLATEDYVYYLNVTRSVDNMNVIALFRMSRAAGAVAESLAATGFTRLWATRTQIVWSRLNGTSGAQLWAVSRASPSEPRLIGSTSDSIWVASNDRFAVSFNRSSATDPATNDASARFIIRSLPDMAVVGRIDMPDPPFSSEAWEATADDTDLYYADDSSIKVASFAALSSSTVLYQGVVPNSQSGFSRTGDWLYWGGGLTPVTYSVFRSHIHSAVPTINTPFDSRVNYFAYDIDRNRVFMWDPDAKRIVAKDMDPAPCASGYACPTGMTCATNGFCSPIQDPIADACAIAKTAEQAACVGAPAMSTSSCNSD